MNPKLGCNYHREIESKDSFGWWDKETPPLPPSTVSLTTPISVEAGAFPFPVCSRRDSTLPAANVAAPGSRIVNRGVNAPGEKPNPVSRDQIAGLRRYTVHGCEPLIGCCYHGPVISSWRHEPRWLEGFSLVGGVPKVMLKPCILRVLYTTFTLGTGTANPCNGGTVPVPTRTITHIRSLCMYMYSTGTSL